MAPLPIEIVDLRHNKDDLLICAIKEMNNRQSDFIFLALNENYCSDLEIFIHDDTEADGFIESAGKTASAWKGYHPFLVYFFDSPINHNRVYNLFSVNSAHTGVAVVTTHNVADVLIPREYLISYIVFQISAYALKFAGWNIGFHKRDRGCVFDYREDKTAIVRAIKGSYICDDCKKQLSKIDGVSSLQFKSIQTLLKFASYALENSIMPKIMKPKIFVGSSVEGLAIARAIQADLEREYDIEIWNQSDVFGLGSSTLEALESAVASYNFGVFVFTADDEIKSRGSNRHVARDNVIFEAGLFIGKFGRFKTFIVKPRDASLQLPSDLHGITVADYDPDKTTVAAQVGPACNRIRSAITSASR